MKNRKNSCSLWILRQIRRRIPMLLVLMTANSLAALAGVSFALFTQRVVDSAVAGDGNGVIKAVLLLIGVLAANVGLSTLSLHLEYRAMADLDRDFKRSLMQKIFRSDYAEISRFHSGELVNRLNNDVRQVAMGILSVLTNTTSLVTSLTAAITILMQMAPVFTVAIVAVSAAIAATTLLLQRKLKNLHKDVSASTGKVSAFLQEAIEKLVMVQALNVAPEMSGRAEALLEERWKTQQKRKNFSLVMSVGSSGVAYIASLVTLVWCASGILRGVITFGQMTAMTQLVAQLHSPMLTLPSMIPRFIAILAAGERLMEIEDIPVQEPPQPEAQIQELYQAMETIRGTDVTFSYDRDAVLDHVSFQIPKGGLTVITGSSGVGKSTLFKLLLGLYRYDGRLSIETAQESISVTRSVRTLFSYVPQGNLLLSGTLRENLLLTKPDAEEAQLQEALYISCMDEYIRTLPQGLDTVLGENAAGLSEGQAQRISLARAVLSGSPVLLLDEVTSALDAETEALVLERIKTLKDRTCIAITHRPKALEMADWQIHITKEKITTIKCG